MGHQTTIFSPMSAPPDYSFDIVSIFPPLNQHSGVGRASAITVRVFIHEPLGGGYDIRLQDPDETLNYSVVTVVGVKFIVSRYHHVL